MSKELIRKHTGDFLDNFERSRAYGVLKQTRYFAPISSDPLAEAKNAKYPALTGAYPAILPMQISTIGKNDKRISFTLLINPETWNEGRTYSYQTTYTRTGWVPQLWGANQDTISSTGKSAAFMLPSTGMAKYFQESTFGYLNFLSLLSAYKNNGYKFEDFTKVNELTRVVKFVYGVQIAYDENILTGHFNNFTLDETEDSPFVFNYNFEFITTIVSGNDIEIRGHYKSNPVSDEDVKGTVEDKALQLVTDQYVKQPNYPTIPPKPTEDKTTIRLWERKTGLPWSEAFHLHQTDGSVQGDLNLRSKLLSMKWDSTKRTFV
jgi:hypothetical protein